MKGYNGIKSVHYLLNEPHKTIPMHQQQHTQNKKMFRMCDTFFRKTEEKWGEIGTFQLFNHKLSQKYLLDFFRVRTLYVI